MTAIASKLIRPLNTEVSLNAPELMSLINDTGPSRRGGAGEVSSEAPILSAAVRALAETVMRLCLLHNPTV